MKDFSNETKKVRRNTRLKEIFKNCSFIAWLPILLCIYYAIGRIEFIIARSIATLSYSSIVNALIYIGAGFFTVVAVLLIIFLVVYINSEISKRKTNKENKE